MTRTSRPAGRRLAILTASLASAAVLGAAAAGSASAEPLPGAFDPQTELQKVVCEPEGSLLRPTGFCEVTGPSGIEGDRVNPHTEDGTSPGLLGLGILGLL